MDRRRARPISAGPDQASPADVGLDATQPADLAKLKRYFAEARDLTFVARTNSLMAQDYYDSEINDGGNELGLDFLAVNDSPANLVGVGVLNDQLVMFSASAVSFWAVSSDPAAPFTPALGRGFQRGCASRDTIALADNALIWVGDNGVVYRSVNTPERVSSSSVEDAIRQCRNWGAMNAFAATFEGQEFYVLNVPGVGTYAYDISRASSAESAYGASFGRGEWAIWESYGRDQFRGRVAAYVDGTVYAGDDSSNDVWEMQVGAWSDGPDPLVRQASAFIKVEEGRPRMDALICHCVTGVGNPVDPGSMPVVEMRYSDDLGRTFSRWRASSLGAQGVYKARPYWQRLGQMRAPGRLIEVRASDPVDVAFSHLELNPLRPAQ